MVELGGGGVVELGEVWLNWGSVVELGGKGGECG